MITHLASLIVGDIACTEDQPVNSIYLDRSDRCPSRPSISKEARGHGGRVWRGPRLRVKFVENLGGVHEGVR